MKPVTLQLFGTTTLLVEDRETLIEVLEALRQTGAPVAFSGAFPPSNPVPASQKKKSSRQRRNDDIAKFNRMYSHLSEKPRLVLTLLYQAGDGLTDVQLRESAEENGIGKTAGCMTAIVKAAKFHRILFKDVIEKKRSRGQGPGSYYFYRIGKIARRWFEIPAETEQDG